MTISLCSTPIRRTAAVTAGLAALLGSIACTREPPRRQERFQAMRQPARVAIGEEEEQTPLADVRALAASQYNTVFQDLSLYAPDSNLARINRYAMTTTMGLTTDGYRVFSLAERYHRQTQGAFDVTTAPLMFLWGFLGGTPPDEPLDDTLLAATLAAVGRDFVRIDGASIRFLSPLTRVEVEGLARTYALDLAFVRLRDRGTRHYLLELGRAARARGRQAPGTPWTVAVPHPRLGEYESIGRFRIDDQRGFAGVFALDETVTIGDREYSSIIDPRTGRPVEHTLAAWVSGPTVTEARALAQALVVLGPEEGLALLPNFPGCEAMIAPRMDPVGLFATPGFLEAFVPSEAMADRVEIW